MTTLATVVNQLRKERDQAQKRIQQLDQALESSDRRHCCTSDRWTAGPRPRGLARAANPVISSTQADRSGAARVRWAKWKAARRSK